MMVNIGSSGWLMLGCIVRRAGQLGCKRFITKRGDIISADIGDSLSNASPYIARSLSVAIDDVDCITVPQSFVCTYPVRVELRQSGFGLTDPFLSWLIQFAFDSRIF